MPPHDSDNGGWLGRDRDAKSCELVSVRRPEAWVAAWSPILKILHQQKYLNSQGGKTHWPPLPIRNFSGEQGNTPGTGTLWQKHCRALRICGETLPRAESPEECQGRGGVESCRVGIGRGRLALQPVSFAQPSPSDRGGQGESLAGSDLMKNRLTLRARRGEGGVLPRYGASSQPARLLASCHRCH